MRIDRAAYEALRTRDLSARDRALLDVLEPKFLATDQPSVEVSEAEWAAVPSDSAIRRAVDGQPHGAFGGGSEAQKPAQK